MSDSKPVSKADALSYPTSEQQKAWGADYLWMWCQGHPKAAAAEIERLRAELENIRDCRAEAGTGDR